MKEIIEKFLFDNKFKEDKNLRYGIYRNRIVSLRIHFTSYLVTISFNEQINKERGQSISEKMSEIKNSFPCIRNIFTKNTGIEVFLYQADDLEINFSKILDRVMEVLEGYKLKTCDTCPLCGRVLSTSNKFVRIGDGVIQAHDECIQQLINASEAFLGQINKTPKLNTFKVILISFLSSILVLATSLMFIKTSSAGGAMILSGCVCFFLSGLLVEKAKIVHTTKRMIVRAIFSLIVVVLSAFIGSLILYEIKLGDGSISNFFINFKNTFSDNVINSKNRIYDILVGIGLLIFSINTELKFASLQRKDIKVL